MASKVGIPARQHWQSQMFLSSAAHSAKFTTHLDPESHVELQAQKAAGLKPRTGGRNSSPAECRRGLSTNPDGRISLAFAASVCTGTHDHLNHIVRRVVLREGLLDLLGRDLLIRLRCLCNLVKRHALERQALQTTEPERRLLHLLFKVLGSLLLGNIHFLISRTSLAELRVHL